MAGAFSFLLLAFAGIPLTSGFTAKFAAFAPAVEAGTGGVVLVVIAVLASAVTAFVYVRLIVLMYFTEASTEEGDEVVALTPSIPSTIGITVGVLVTAVLGIVPGFLLDIASSASEFPDAQGGHPAQRGTPSVLDLPGATADLRERLGSPRSTRPSRSASTTTTRSSPRPEHTSRRPGANASVPC